MKQFYLNPYVRIFGGFDKKPVGEMLFEPWLVSYHTRASVLFGRTDEIFF